MPDILSIGILDSSCTIFDIRLDFFNTFSFAGSCINLLTSAPAQAKIAWSSSPARYISLLSSFHLSYNFHCSGDKSCASSIKTTSNSGTLSNTLFIMSLKS